jgi:hypothetical protein
MAIQNAANVSRIEAVQPEGGIVGSGQYLHVREGVNVRGRSE